MNSFNKIVEEYCDMFSNLARVWNSNQDSWTDEKAKEFSIQIMKPISGSGKKIIEATSNITSILDKMYADKMIQNK